MKRPLRRVSRLARRFPARLALLAWRGYGIFLWWMILPLRLLARLARARLAV
ncbi:MAG: hypothetical protein FJ102_05190 [Deltaproteobacteria bacterium]|nr:hypothetical protein [Deltaproteobacteria bacterium]